MDGCPGRGRGFAVQAALAVAGGLWGRNLSSRERDNWIGQSLQLLATSKSVLAMLLRLLLTQLSPYSLKSKDSVYYYAIRAIWLWNSLSIDLMCKKSVLNSESILREHYHSFYS